MKENGPTKGQPPDLRSRAEKDLKRRKAGSDYSATEADPKKLLHELQVHQLELEIQNEELKRAREEAETALERYTDLYDFAPVGYFTFDCSGVIGEVNLTGAKLLGTDRSSLLTKRFEFFIAHEDRPVLHSFLKRVFERKDKQSCEVALRNQDRLIQMEAIVSPGGQECRAVLADITERAKAEREVKRLNEDLSRRNSELEVANRELDSFAYVVSHDLRAPLRSIEGFSRILLDEYSSRLDEQGRDYLNRVKNASSRMDQFLINLLNLARLARREVEIEEVNLSNVAADIAEKLKLNDPGRKVGFTIAQGLKANADLYLVRVALGKIIENAWKFTSTTASAEIEFGSLAKGGETIFFLRDNGVGFDMKYAGRLFQPFQRFHGESEFPGAGIGLATAFRIIGKMGGKIWAEAEPGKGATFYFTLPH